MPVVSTSSAADGKSRSEATRSRTGAWRHSGLRSNDAQRLGWSPSRRSSVPMTARGKVLLTIIILAVVGYGASKWWDRLKPGPRPAPTPRAEERAVIPELVETQREVPL